MEEEEEGVIMSSCGYIQRPNELDHAHGIVGVVHRDYSRRGDGVWGAGEEEEKRTCGERESHETCREWYVVCVVRG